MAFNPGINLTVDTAKREIKGKIVSGVFPKKIRNVEIIATLNRATTSKNNLGVCEIRLAKNVIPSEFWTSFLKLVTKRYSLFKIFVSLIAPKLWLTVLICSPCSAIKIFPFDFNFFYISNKKIKRELPWSIKKKMRLVELQQLKI